MIRVERAPSDRVMLSRLLGCEKLGEDERQAFESMVRALRFGHLQRLSDRQRAWCEEAYQRLELDAEEGAKNLVSRGLVAKECNLPPLDYELMHRPLKPPGR